MTKKVTDLNDVLSVIGDLATMVAGRLDQHDSRFDKLEMQLFKQGEDIKELKSDVAAVKEKVDHSYGVLDGHMKRIEDILQENKLRDYQQERM